MAGALLYGFLTVVGFFVGIGYYIYDFGYVVIEKERKKLRIPAQPKAPPRLPEGAKCPVFDFHSYTSPADKKKYRAVVTGATGFLGGSLVRRLLELETASVVGVGRNAEKGRVLEDLGAEFARLDLTDAEGVAKVCEGADVVFHCAALCEPWGDYELFRQSNLVSTETIIEGCLKHKVGRLVFVSSPSIYVCGRDRLQIKEDDDLPEYQVNAYAHTKVLAELAVDKAVAEKGLHAVTIRPRAIFGPGDTTLLPRLLDRLMKKRLKIIGDGTNLGSVAYVDNVVESMLLCAKSPAKTIGQKYNISDGPPILLWQMVNTLCEHLSLPAPTRKVPLWLADRMALVVESVYTAFPSLNKLTKEPVITQYAVWALSNNLTIDIQRAYTDLKYRPEISSEEGVRRFAVFWRAEQRHKYFIDGRDRPANT